MLRFHLCMLCTLTIWGASGRQTESFVGFTAWAEQVIEYKDVDVLRYTGILVNEGNHYSSVTGMFTCPTDGIYFVSASAAKNNNDSMHFQIRKDDVRLNYFYGLTPENPNSTFNFAGLTTCNASSQIYQSGIGYGGIPGSVYGNPLVPRSTFSVMLLHETNNQNLDSKHDELIGLSIANQRSQKYSNGDTIIYEEELYNSGATYIQPLNMFICPVSGLYYVDISSRKQDDEAYHVVVRKNSNVVLDSEDTSVLNGEGYVTNNGLIQCDANDTIRVQGASEGWIDGNSVPVSFYTIFMISQISGFDERKHKKAIGFTAYKQSNQSYEAADVIIFDGILYNGGGHYQKGLSRFVCPVSGIYYVTLNAKKQDKEPLNLYVDHQSDQVFQLENGLTGSDGVVLSSSALIRAFSGDTVQVRAAGSGAVHGDYTAEQSTFTVFLMHQY